MEDAPAQSVLQRMARPPQPVAADIPLTVSRAVKLAATRAADRSIKLALTVVDLAEETIDLDDLLAKLSDDHLIMALSKGGDICGMMAGDIELVAAVSEVQTFGAVMPDTPESRPVSGADASLFLPLLDAMLSELADTTQNTALDGWASGTSLDMRFDRARSVGFALADQPYRLIHLTLALDGTDRSGQLMVALPSAAEQPRALLAEDVPQDWSSAFQAAVYDAPVQLDAILHRFDMPLATATDLAPGHVIPLRGASISKLRLEDLAGTVVLQGRMGQLDGDLAVRIEEPTALQMDDLSDQAAPAGGLSLPGMSSELDDSPVIGLDLDTGPDIGLTEAALDTPTEPQMPAMELPGNLAVEAPEPDAGPPDVGLPDLPMGQAVEPQMAALELPTDDQDDADEDVVPPMMAAGMDLSALGGGDDDT